MPPAFPFVRAATRLTVFTQGCVVGALALAVACSSDKPVAPPQPDVLTIVSGDAQSGLINKRLSNSLTVKVTTAGGAPHAGVHLQWTVTSGHGSLAATASTTDAQGISTASWTLGPIVGAQAVSVQISGSMVPAVSFSASALIPTIILRYDGTTWHSELGDSAGVNMRLDAVWGSSASQVFSAGTCNGTLLQLSAAQWNRVAVGCNSGFVGTAVSGRSATDVFLTTRDALPPSANSTVWHYDGQSITSSYFRACSFCHPSFNAIWTAVGADVFVVGDSGVAVRFDGSSWTTMASGTTSSLKAVWGAASDHVFAVGDTGTILFYDGTSWSRQTTSVTETLNGVWGRSASDVFAVGAHGTLLHFDGTAWTAVSSGTTEDLYAISGTSGQVFAVGNNSTVVRFDGTAWSTQSVSAPIDLRGVWVASPTAAFAVGAPR